MAELELEKQSSSSKLDKIEVYAYDCYLLLDSKTRGYLELKDIPTICSLTAQKTTLLSPEFFENNTVQVNGEETIEKKTFVRVLQEHLKRDEQAVVHLRERIYAAKVSYIPPVLRRIFLGVRYGKAKSSLSVSEKPHKNHISAVWGLFTTGKEALDQFSDIVLLAYIYHYGMRRENSDNMGYMIVFVARLLAILSNYLIAYSSGIQLLLHKGIFDPMHWKNHSFILKTFLSFCFTFISPLYFVFLTLFDIAKSMLEMIACFLVPDKHYPKVVEFMEGLMERVGLTKQEFEGLTEQKSMIQLMFQNLPLLLIDTLVLARVFDCPELVNQSLSQLLISYGLTIFNLFTEILTLKVNANYLQEDFLGFCLISMKAKFGWIPFLNRLKTQDLTHNIVDYHLIQCPIPVITPVLGEYKRIAFEFSDLTIRQLIEAFVKIKISGQIEDRVQEIKIGKCVSKVSIQVLLQLLSSKPPSVKLNMEGVDWKECIKFSRHIGRVPHHGKWEALTPLRENMLSVCIESEEGDSFEYFDLLKTLLEEGADPNTKDAYGEPILLYAVKENKIGSVNLLLKNKADPNILGAEGKSCSLLLALETEDWEMAELLVKHGADAHIKITHDGQEMTLMSKLIKAISREDGFELEKNCRALHAVTKYCKAETLEEKDTLLHALALITSQYEHPGREDALPILQAAINEGDDYGAYKDIQGRNFLHYFLIHSDSWTKGGGFLEIATREGFQLLQEDTDLNGDRPIDYLLKNFKPKAERECEFAFKSLDFDWNDKKLMANMVTWVSDLLRTKRFPTLNENLRLLNQYEPNAPTSGELCAKAFSKHQQFLMDREITKYVEENFGYRDPNQPEQLPVAVKQLSSEPIQVASKRNSSVPNKETITKKQSAEKKDEEIIQTPDDEIKKEETTNPPSNPPSSNRIPETTLALVPKIQSQAEIAAEMEMKRQATLRQKAKKGFNIIIIIVTLLEFAALFDLVTDIIILKQLVSAGHIAWTSLTVLSMVTPYFISYSPLITFLIERNVFAESKSRKSNIARKVFGGFFLTPLCLIYFLALDLVYTFVELAMSLFELLAFVFTLGNPPHVHAAEEYLDKMFQKAFNLNNMDVRGLRRLRTISQMIFESVPQLILQLRMFAVGAIGLGINVESLGISMGLAVVHLILELLLLYCEARASKASLHFYSVVCLNGRLNWVPFIEKLTRSREEKESFDFDGMEYRLGDKTFKIEYEFYNITMDSLVQAVSLMPKLLDKQEQVQMRLGKTCKNVDFQRIVFLIKMSQDKLQLFAEDLEWDHIIRNTYPGEIPKEPKGLDDENMVISLSRAACATGLQKLLERGCNANVRSSDGESLLFLAVKERSLGTIQTLLDFNAEARQIINHYTPCSKAIETEDLSLIQAFLGHKNVRLSSFLRKKVLTLAMKLADKNEDDTLKLINLIGGVDGYIWGQKLESIALSQNQNALLKLFGEWKENLPALVWVSFEGFQPLEVQRTIIEKFKTLRLELPGRSPIGIDAASGGDGSRKKPFELSKFGIDPKAFVLLYEILVTETLPSIVTKADIVDIDKAANIVGLDETVFPIFYSITAPLRDTITIERKDAKGETIRAGGSPVLVPEPSDFVPWREDPTDFPRFYKKLDSFELGNDVVAISNIHFVGGIEDQGFGGTNKCSICLYVKAPTTVFFDHLVMVDRSKYSGKDYDIVFDGKEKCMDIQRMPIGGSVVEIWLQCAASPNWAVKLSEYKVTLTCIKKTNQ